MPGKKADVLTELGVEWARKRLVPDAFEMFNLNQRIVAGLGSGLSDLMNCLGIDPRLIAAEALEDQNYHTEAEALRAAAFLD